jgi:hypothetical protein
LLSFLDEEWLCVDAPLAGCTITGVFPGKSEDRKIAIIILNPIPNPNPN